MLALVAATVPITIITNAMRVVVTGLIGQQFGVEYASGFFHEFAGLAIYTFAFLCMLAVHSLIVLISRRLGRHRG
jgi:exosortase/archaeosortase family protein